MRENKNALPPYIKSIEFMTPEEKKHFDWRKRPEEANVVDDVVFDHVFKAAEDYMQKHHGKLYDQLLNGIR
jgi:hypothetical protein